MKPTGNRCETIWNLRQKDESCLNDSYSRHQTIPDGMNLSKVKGSSEVGYKINHYN